jgi:hypothetical protein
MTRVQFLAGTEIFFYFFHCVQIGPGTYQLSCAVWTENCFWWSLNTDEETGGWRKMHNEELYNLYSSPSVIRMIMSRRVRYVGHAARMGRKGMYMGYFWGKPEGKRPLGKPNRR